MSSTRAVVPIFRYVATSDMFESPTMTCSRRYRSASAWGSSRVLRSEEHTSELQSRSDLVCRLLLEKKKNDCIALVVAAAKAATHRVYTQNTAYSCEVS